VAVDLGLGLPLGSFWLVPSAFPAMGHWKASFSINWNNSFGRSYLGFVVIRPGDSNAILLSSKERIMDYHHLEDGESL
jgi:hypothetical protein